jgi:Tfp pilus assembly protein PilN
VILIQAPPPIPNPPSIPVDPNLILTNMDSPAIVMIFLLVTTACTIVLWPLARALARRLEGRGGHDAVALRGEVEHLQQRLGEVDQLQIRIADLEERLDFTERMLAQSREPDRLQR